MKIIIYILFIYLVSSKFVHNQNQNSRDTRMIIQDSNKDFYRQEANNRMMQYSPLSRASHCPTSIANLSVNDFYNNNNINLNIHTCYNIYVILNIFHSVHYNFLDWLMMICSMYIIYPYAFWLG